MSGGSGEAGSEVKGGKRESRGEATACLPPIQTRNNACLSVRHHLKAQRE